MDADSPYAGSVVENIAPTLMGATGTITGFGSTLFIAIQDHERGEIWISDGTTAGTHPLLALHGRVLIHRSAVTDLKYVLATARASQCLSSGEYVFQIYRFDRVARLPDNLYRLQRHPGLCPPASLASHHILDSSEEPDMINIPSDLFARLTDSLAYAA